MCLAIPLRRIIDRNGIQRCTLLRKETEDRSSGPLGGFAFSVHFSAFILCILHPSSLFTIKIWICIIPPNLVRTRLLDKFICWRKSNRAKNLDFLQFLRSFRWCLPTNSFLSILNHNFGFFSEFYNMQLPALKFVWLIVCLTKFCI